MRRPVDEWTFVTAELEESVGHSKAVTLFCFPGGKIECLPVWFNYCFLGKILKCLISQVSNKNSSTADGLGLQLYLGRYHCRNSLLLSFPYFVVFNWRKSVKLLFHSSEN